MSLFREITVNWDGGDCIIVPNLKLLKRIEDAGISLSQIAISTSKERVPMAAVSEVMSILLQSAKAPNSSPEDVYSVLMSSDQSAVVQILETVLTAFQPNRGEADAEVSPAQTAKKKK